MKSFICTGIFVALLGLSGCASTSDQGNGKGQNQFYGEIKGGVENSHSH